MPNYKQAPKLYHNKNNFYENNYYGLPQELMDCVFQQLDGKCGNQIKLMIVLLGTAGDGTFGVSEKWICDRTGMLQQTYNTARKALIERGWIYLDKEEGRLFVLPSIIKYGFNYPENATDKDKEAIKIGTISKCVNDIKNAYGLAVAAQCDIVAKAQYDNVAKAQCDNVYNKKEIQINETEKISIGLSSPDGADSPTLDGIQVGEITQAQADSIIDKQMLSADLLLTSTGRYYRIKG